MLRRYLIKLPPVWKSKQYALIKKRDAEFTASRFIFGTGFPNGVCLLKVQVLSRKKSHPKKGDSFFGAGDKKDILGSFAYEFELLQKMKSLLTQG